MTVTIDPPARLPIDRLSLSSIRLFMQCPERWKRRYLDRVYEPPSGKMILGSAAGAAEAQHYGRIVESGEGLTCEQVLDEFSSEWEDRIGREEIDWGQDKPGELKDSGAAALQSYHVLLAPAVVPTSVEREFTLSWPGVDWSLIGYLDLEEADGTVSDLKMRGRRLSSSDAAADLQPTVYLAARRAEGNPARRFCFHTMVRTKHPTAELVPTRRTDRQLDLLTDRVFAVAREMVWRTENDAWSGAAPGTWFCSNCGYASNCPWYLG